MGWITDNYDDDILFDDNETDKVNSPKGRVGDAPRYYRKRFLSPRYVKNLTEFSFKQQVVIKVAGKGFGRQHSKTLMKYLMRELEYQKQAGEEGLTLEDSFGEKITPDKFSSFLDSWEKDYQSKRFYKGSDFEELEKYSSRRSELEEKLNDGDISQPEVKELDDLTFRNPLAKKAKVMRKDFTHIIFSPGGRFDPEKGKAAIQRFLQENVQAKGFDYVTAFHNDTSNPHFHVVVKHTNAFDKRKSFALDKYDLFAWRMDFQRQLDLKGIDRTATKRFDRQDYLEKLQKAPLELLTKVDQFERKLGHIDDSFSFDAFTFRKRIRTQLNKYEQQLKREVENKKKDSNNLAPALKEVRKIKKEFEKVTPETFFQMRKRTTAELSRIDEKTAQEFENNLDLPVESNKAKKQRVGALIGAIDYRRTKMIETAIEELKVIKTLQVGPGEKKAFLKQLEDMKHALYHPKDKKTDKGPEKER